MTAIEAIVILLAFAMILGFYAFIAWLFFR